MADRARNFATIIYPESAPNDFLLIAKDAKVNFFLSPLHDKDCDKHGELKKPHYHMLLMYDSVHTVAQASGLFVTFGGVGCESVNSLRSYARYLCHLDDDDKFRYNVSDVYTYGSVDYGDIISSPVDKYDFIADMMDFCDKNDIVSFADLLRYSRRENKRWFKCLCDGNSLIMLEYLRSRTWEHDYFSNKSSV